jgi:hypothetical protein
MAYDSARDRIVLYGATYFPTTPPDTFEWDGSDWLRRLPGMGPLERSQGYHAMVYDSARGRVLLFGVVLLTTGETWEYGPTDPAAFAPFGRGCTGSAGTPALAAAPGRGPWLGANYAVELASLPASAPALVLLGRSKTSWGAITLPVPLDSLGMTGCTLFASAEFLFPVVAAAGVARLSLPIPDDRSLLGTTSFTQGLVVDPAANPFGATLSNAAEQRIGAK